MTLAVVCDADCCRCGRWAGWAASRGRAWTESKGLEAGREGALPRGSVASSPWASRTASAKTAAHRARVSWPSGLAAKGVLSDPLSSQPSVSMPSSNLSAGSQNPASHTCWLSNLERDSTSVRPGLLVWKTGVIALPPHPPGCSPRFPKGPCRGEALSCRVASAHRRVLGWEPAQTCPHSGSPCPAQTLPTSTGRALSTPGTVFTLRTWP